MNAEQFSLLARLGFALAVAAPSRDVAAASASDAPPSAPASPSGDAIAREPERHAVRVRVFKVAGGTPLFARLVAELRAQGFEVAEEPEPLPGSGDAPDAVGDQVREAVASPGHAEAVLALASTPLVIRIWIANAVTGRQLFREVQREQNTLPDTAIVALWAVELLRATGFSADLREATAPPAPPAPVALPKRPSAPVPLPTPSETLSLYLGPAVLLSPGGLGPSYAIALGAEWQPSKHAGLETEWLVPVSTQTVERAQGSALVSLTIGTLGGFVALGPRNAGWSGRVGAGLALAWLSASGTDAQQPFAARSDRAFAAGPYLRASLARRVASRFGLRFDVLSGAAMPRPVIAFGDTAVAHWGRPWCAAQLTTEAAF